MKKCALLILAAVLTAAISHGQTDFLSDPNDDAIGSETAAYFKTLFELLRTVAEKEPDADSFRDVMQPVAKETEGFYGASLLDADWVIVQVYYPSHFLARGFDLHKVRELTPFIEKMNISPSPQLSEPGHGSLIQPRLISLRCPMIRDGKMSGLVSMMIKTEAFLEAVGLDRCKAWRITCMGRVAEEKGQLSASARTVKLTLPATEWVIEYDPK